MRKEELLWYQFGWQLLEPVIKNGGRLEELIHLAKTEIAKGPKQITDIWILGLLGEVSNLQGALCPGLRRMTFRDRAVAEIGKLMTEFTKWAYKQHGIRVVYIIPSHFNPLTDVACKIDTQGPPMTAAKEAFKVAHQELMKGEETAIKMANWLEELEGTVERVRLDGEGPQIIEFLSMSRIIRSDAAYWAREKSSWTDYKKADYTYLSDGVHWTPKTSKEVVKRMITKYKRGFESKKFVGRFIQGSQKAKATMTEEPLTPTAEQKDTAESVASMTETTSTAADAEEGGDNETASA